MLDNEAPNVGIAVPGEAAPEPIDSGAPLADQGAPEIDNETRARAMGWAPKEEFRGPADKWVDADTFVKRGEEHVPILRENVKRLTEKLAQLEARDRQRDDELRRIETTSQIALQRQREQLIGSYEAAKRAAVANMDTAQYDQLSRDQSQALQQFDQQYREQVQPQRQPQQGQALPPDAAATVDNWRRENSWFEMDPVLNSVAQAVHMQMLREKPGISLQDNLKATAEEVRRRFPEKFGWQQPAQQRQTINQSAVEGGERIPSNGMPRRKGAADLPADARRAAESFIKQGLFKDLNDYASTYWSQQ